jgi:hypothetical protein
VVNFYPGIIDDRRPARAAAETGGGARAIDLSSDDGGRRSAAAELDLANGLVASLTHYPAAGSRAMTVFHGREEDV